MDTSDLPFALETVNQLRENFRVEVLADWEAESDSGWSRDELERLHRNINLMATAMGGSDRFIANLEHVTIQKADIGTHGGEALAHKVTLSAKRPATAWTIVHELAHAWDANHGWRLSMALEKYTGGFTHRTLGWIKRWLRRGDAGVSGAEKTPGRFGRLPGCNAAGYFYARQPSGSNWNFNRKEDFAESVAMYLGWQNGNDLSAWAELRINLYLLPNGAPHERFGTDNWADYKHYFYPENGDYSRTLRWKFVDELLKQHRV